MKILCTSFIQLKTMIESKEHKIIMFGAGVVGQVTMPSILERYGLLKYIDCYVDNDQTKWNKEICYLDYSWMVKSPGYLNECEPDSIIMLNISRYSEALQQLEGMTSTQKTKCFLSPMMCIYNMCSETSGGTPIFLDEPIIPKKIHYMWLGKKEIPDNLKKCMDSWQRFCPDYEIIEWNENNYDIEKNSYMKDAYSSKAYGFVPDYARLDILYSEGGFYLDTDVELIKPLDDMRYQEAFCGVEKWQVLNFGGCSGAVKGNKMIKRFLDSRSNISFFNLDGSQNRKTCGFYDTFTAIKEGYVLDGTTQNINGMNIFAYDYFHPYDYMSGLCGTNEHTYSIHHFNGGWLDEKMILENQKTQRKYSEIYSIAVNNICM